MENNQQSFWQFSDQLRLQSSNLANLSLNDSIWSSNYATKRTDQRMNFDIKVGGEINSNTATTNFNPKPSADYNLFNDSWKMPDSSISNGSLFSVPHNTVPLNGAFNKGIYSKPSYLDLNMNINSINSKANRLGGKSEDPKAAKRNNTSGNKKNTDNNENKDTKAAVDKRFKTLPPSESLPRNETIGGYIFVCNNDTMAENLKRQLFGLPPRYRDSVRAITPGLPLFLYNYSTHQLHGIFEAASFGGTNIDPTAWEDKKCPGESRFPAQVRVITRKICEPLEEDSFRPILHHYDGPKFRLELNVPEALSLLDIFADQNTFKEVFNAIPA
ncbi:LOW QUALITY PROTEIN: B2 protein [Neltuma alba]|uniref:LOW QUALITY PROTEIN: B2 protein n=1 Tax=Neltuma alba TaxID=207710 RepID=UPI0010A41FF7|nr:LOW QUALITY PROTEIN: B2 protein [Prosopis alba]